MAAEPDSLPAVLVEGATKTFRNPREHVHTLKERAMHPLRRATYDPLVAMQDINFAVMPGEFFGIVGRNGSGKSTLLKCLAGIYSLDRGDIYVRGRLSTFIELGVGFNPELAARDNVKINAIMLGLTPRQAEERYHSVIEFAELEDFTDLKLKNYSSGMQVRLAFSVMVQSDADILLIDEVLAVGDVSFQQKCFDVFNRLRDQQKTILFVTHDMAQVKRFCHRAMLLENGVMKAIGEPDHVTSDYLELNFGRDASIDRSDDDHVERFGDGAGLWEDAWFEDEHGQRTERLWQGKATTFRARARFTKAVENPALAVLFENEAHQPLFATSTDWADENTGSFQAGDEVTISIAFDNAFAPGRVHATPWMVYRRSPNLLDRRPQMASVLVTGNHVSGALVDLPHDVSIERGGVQVATGRAEMSR
ncbi:MAG: ABC transporter ATP-binding protein [Thermoleophilaceae bacterium]|nr:ABC transporter ATP-binding protein [Thermoleophilaceae bacterium]